MSRAGLEDVATTKFVFNEEDVKATSPRPPRHQGDLGKVATTSPRLCGDSEATSPRKRLTYFYRPRKEIIKEKLKLVYTCKT